jgi:DNA-binding response OmpR family regulator
VIVVTASDSQGDEARELGANDYLVKSRYSNAELLGRIARHLTAAA